jgi:Mg2+ and Co2+ transporter CorA
VFTYYLKEKITTRKERRREAEKKADKAGKPIKYPTIEELRAEDEEKTPSVFLIVKDDAGEVVRRITGSRDKGIHRTSWNLRYPASTPTSLSTGSEHMPWWQPPSGPLALPGTYTATLVKEVDGEVTELVGPESFEVIPLELATFAAKDRDEVMAFQKKVARLQRAAWGAMRVVNETQTRIDHIRKAVLDTPAADPAMLVDIHGLQQQLNTLRTKLQGDRTISKRQDASPPAITTWVRSAIQWSVTSPPTQTERDAYRYAGTEFTKVLSELRKLVQEDLTGLEARLEAAGAPWTPGRIPIWKME